MAESIPSVPVQQLRAPAKGPLRAATPRCEATRVYSYLSDRGRPPGQCEKSSSYVIQGRHLCKAHAGDFALQLLLQHAANQATAAAPQPPPATP